MMLSNYLLLTCTTANYTYIEGWKTIELSNSIFGFDGWSCSIVDLTPDFVSNSLTGLVANPV